ncbi:MAG TPA: bifunctional diaminohydroxyphosphoribosylaminopyrimidine deaminase/5-amino-6-(5-phosphoribosylamino)uracil reductase RibD [Anaerolineales bacterium]|nr:bifunctional diaminohydroxyphosphoribosylaminopyrimidine deaminase/5-amino-6-(5-phosphoribosylamino)uracil reductase RibD [Anaerolineales bacterium]
MAIEFSAFDSEMMAHTIQLAAQALGFTSPNPMVGAVVVRDGKIVGEGYHHAAGLPHAEVEALRMAGTAAQGATLYVNLEPCNHFGRTPPCTQAILASGIARVVYAISDPNPRVNGKGHQALQQAGVQVESGLLASAAEHLNRFYLHHTRTGKPYVIAKWAMSLDGKIATRTKDARWISNSASRLQGHRLRAEVNAIVVGKGTILADNPQLTTRLPDQPNAHQPLRVILDSHAQLPLASRVFSPDVPGETLLVTLQTVPESLISAWNGYGIKVLQLPADRFGKVDLSAMLDKLGRQGVQSMLVEGGSAVLGNFAEQHLIDEVCVFVAPILIGGATAPSPLAGLGIEQLSQARPFAQVQWQNLENDLWLVARRAQ